MGSGLSQGSSKTVGRAEKKLELTSTSTRQRANTNTGGYRNTLKALQKNMGIHSCFFSITSRGFVVGKSCQNSKKRETRTPPTHCAGIFKPNGIFQFQFDSLLFKSLILTLKTSPSISWDNLIPIQPVSC